MKQSVQQIKRKQTSAVNKKPPSVTRLRPRVVNQSNHTKLANDKWECQADEAAERILRGEHNIAAMLTPAPVAGKKVPTSSSKPLPRLLRKHLEQGFGADLSQVRVHLDAGANAEVVAEHAKAFTSGTHIYFAQGVFDPASAAGEQLLTHEVAHVLQQTGRKSHNGIVRATDVTGCGNIQFAKWPSFKKLRKLHRVTSAARAGTPKSKSDVEKYDVLADEIQKIVKNKTDLSTDATIKTELGNLVDQKRMGMAAYPAEAESLL